MTQDGGNFCSPPPCHDGSREIVSEAHHPWIGTWLPLYDDLSAFGSSTAWLRA